MRLYLDLNTLASDYSNSNSLYNNRKGHSVIEHLNEEESAKYAYIINWSDTDAENRFIRYTRNFENKTNKWIYYI